MIAGKWCPRCGCEGKTLYEHEGVPVRECCGILLAWAWESPEAYEAQYASEEAEYHSQSMLASGRQPFVMRDAEYLNTAIQRLRRIRQLYPNHHDLMDVGCGTGSLVAVAPSFGINAIGIEPSSLMVKWANRQGRMVRQGTWKDVGGPWAIITLFDVFEHLLDPQACLGHLRDCLTPTGTMVLEMPEYNAPAGQWRRHQKNFEHPCIYSVNAAVAMFEAAGLRWDSIERPLGGTLAKMTFRLRKL